MRLLRPALAGSHLRDQFVACGGAAMAIALTFVVCAAAALTGPELPAIVAPLGASAVLVFAVPSSPLAQPWSVIGGNVVSVLVGAIAYKTVTPPALAAGVAVGSAIAAMALLRCLHPPGGAAALTAVIGSEGVHDAGLGFAFSPVAVNAVLLVALGIAFHRATGRSYPHRPPPPPPREPPGLHLDDIDAALEEMHEGFDISREDLDALLTRAELHAEARRSKRTR